MDDVLHHSLTYVEIFFFNFIESVYDAFCLLFSQPIDYFPSVAFEYILLAAPPLQNFYPKRFWYQMGGILCLYAKFIALAIACFHESNLTGK